MMVSLHCFQQLLDRLTEANKHGATDDAVANVQFNQMWHLLKQREVHVIESMSGIDLRSELARLTGGIDEPLKFSIELLVASAIRIVECFGKGTGVQFDELT